MQANKRLTKKLPKQCEVANILVGQVCNKEYGAVVVVGSSIVLLYRIANHL